MVVTLFVSLLIVSCEKKTETFEPTSEQKIENFEERVNFLLPKGLENSSGEKIEIFFKNADDETLLKLAVSYKVYNYLQSISKLELVKDDMAGSIFYADVDLSKQLNFTELENLKTFNVNAISDQISSRSCQYAFCARSGAYWCSNYRYTLYFDCGTYWSAACANSCNIR